MYLINYTFEGMIVTEPRTIACQDLKSLNSELEYLMANPSSYKEVTVDKVTALRRQTIKKAWTVE